jgi:hypothetical protein
MAAVGWSVRGTVEAVTAPETMALRRSLTG